MRHTLRLQERSSLLLMFLVIAVSVHTSAACMAQVQSSAHESFRLLGHGLRYPWFPTNDEEFSDCYSERNTPCIERIEDAIKAIRGIFEQGRSAALAATLNTIQTYCPTKISTETPDKSECWGAVASLYFFDRKVEDQRILAFVKQAPPALVELLFTHAAGSWLFNRPDQRAWRQFIDNYSQLSPDAKIGYKDLMKNSTLPNRMKTLSKQQRVVEFIAKD